MQIFRYCPSLRILIDGKLSLHLFGFKLVQLYGILLLEMSISIDKLLPQYGTLAQASGPRYIDRLYLQAQILH